MNSKLLLLVTIIAFLVSFSFAQTAYEQDLEILEQGKFWKKLGKALGKVIQGADISASFEETQTMAVFGKYMDKYSHVLDGVLTQDEVNTYTQVRSIVQNCLAPPVRTTTVFDDDENQAEQARFWKKFGKALKKVIKNVDVSVVLDEEPEEGEAFWHKVGEIIVTTLVQTTVDGVVQWIEDIGKKSKPTSSKPKPKPKPKPKAKAVSKTHKFEEDEDVELYDQEAEVSIVDSQGKFWKKLGNVLKKITISGSVTFSEEEEMTLRRFHKQTDRLATALPMNQEGALVLAHFHHKIGHIANRINTRGQVILDEEDAIMEAEQGKFWKKLGKALKKVIKNVDVSVVLDQDNAEAVNVTKHGKFWKMLGTVLRDVDYSVKITTF